ncbi:MAG TPA: nucleoside monophosphate kinase [Patescibacteria group bacterium]|nr:nucleoside monophosphate kinase [Patescibacteria group bacterium]
MKIVLIGIQGSGKSTQGNLLQEKLGVPYLATGHIFRTIAKEDTSLGREIKHIMNAGYLIPDEKTIEIVEEYLSRPEYQKGYILDGFPRTVKQADAFGEGVDMVIYLRISDQEALNRIANRRDASREDETQEAIKKRIESFHEFTKPVIAYYQEKGKLAEIDGEQSIDAIHTSILTALHHEK